MKKININYNIILIFASSIFFLATLAIGGFLYLDIFYSAKFFPNIKIAGIKVGNKTKAEATELLTSKIQEWNEQSLKVSRDEKSWEIPNKDLGFDFNIDSTIETAFKAGRDGNLLDQFFKRAGILFFSQKDSLKNNKDNIQGVIEKISEEADVNALNNGLRIENGEISETGEQAGRKVNDLNFKYQILDYALNLSSSKIYLPQNVVYPNSDPAIIEKIKQEASDILKSKLTLKAKNKKWDVGQNDIQNWIDIGSQDKISAFRYEVNYDIKLYLNYLSEELGAIKFLNNQLEINLKKEKVEEYLKNIASEINKPAKNATLGVEGEKVVVLGASQSGEELDIGNSSERILNALKKKEELVNLPMKIITAQVREDNYIELGIIELIGRGQSDASGSSSARRTNIKVGSAKINGVLVAPGEEFSLNQYLVPVDETNGFLPELVIKPGKLVKEYGGGLCQVATTTFRAALYAGVPITERKNHAFAVHYYDWPFPGPGVDATIYPPHPDLRFKNDTGYYILIQTSISGNRLTYDFYGTKGGRRAEVENPTYVAHNSDGSSQTIFYRNIYKNDKLIKRDSFTSYYKPASEFPKTGE